MTGKNALTVNVLAVGMIAPGLPNWSTARAVLRGDAGYSATAPLQVPPPLQLAPNERRRATLPTRLALAAASDATRALPELTNQLHTVFASADGDMNVIDQLCRAIYQQHTLPSPTVFQNSVHNAPAGYWSIAEQCQQPSSSLAAGDGSFAAGLLEAALQCHCTNQAVLLVAVDVPAPELLHPHRPLYCAFACAFLLSANLTAIHALAHLTLSLCPIERPPLSFTCLSNAALETMRLGNPAARSLPLFAALATEQMTRIQLPYWPDLLLDVQVQF